jgi:AbiV family abortive infection protein
MSRIAPSEVLCRQGALACYRNAESLCEDAKLLIQHGQRARAVALALIGREEFAKAIVYTLAALLPDDRQILVEKISELRFHEVKHLIAMIAEVAPLACSDGIAAAEQDAGYSMSPEDYLAVLLREMARLGLAEIIGTRVDAKEFYKWVVRDSNWPFIAPSGKHLLEIERKDAALYVDLTRDGEVLTPDRVADYAASDVEGTSLFLKDYGALPQILEDDAKWEKFARSFRS